ncbi:MAG: hypothetical protein KBC02_01490 [Candidatus Pacebacteria bacterium]|nr:hypothetical protein [Candidatus Paceibacterota bacterium]
MFTQYAWNLGVKMVRLYGLALGPVVMLIAILAAIAPLVDMLTLSQTVLYPVLSCVTFVGAVGAISYLPLVLHRGWFLLAFVCHLYCGVVCITTDSVLIVVFGLIFLAYSFWELCVVVRLPKVSPAPADPS